MTTALVPPTLDGWTFEAVEALCAAGQSESDRHDFKFNLPDAANLTKISCAFANTFGGFIVFGVRENSAQGFELAGLEPDREFYSKLSAKIKAEPDIAISAPSVVGIPGTSKVLYVFAIAQSARRPHLPTPPDQRIFWKRQGSDCTQMTLEEIRYQMNTYEEKREKLALLLVDLHHKVTSLEAQANMQDNYYNGDVYSFDIIDRVVSESYALLKDDLTTIGALETIRRGFMLMNAEKQKMLSILSMSYDQGFKNQAINNVRDMATKSLPSMVILVEQIERSLKERFGITNPYKLKR